ncbi:MAG: hypothetical protein LAQ69_12955 [Acidobacteriia bacterium]|nr:hypothetical protein [Terriglobia bacterium]
MIPVSSQAQAGQGEPIAALVLSLAAWRRYFNGDAQIVGRVLEVAEQPALVTGVISEDAWRLPGRVDAWLLEDQQHMAKLPSHSKGLVLAHLGTSALHAQTNGLWLMSLPNHEGGSSGFDCVSLAQRDHRPFAAFLLMILIAWLVLPATTSLSLGEYPATSHSPGWAARLRRWIFLATKIALILPIVYCASLDLACLIASAGSVQSQPHALLVGWILAFRWVLRDQRQRCPVCLRLLANPIGIGQASQTFLGWYGTELMCVKGHGLLHVPDIPTSSFRTQRWLPLDASWSELFS